MEAIRIVLGAVSMLLVMMMMMMIIISSASMELTEEAPSPSSTTTTAAASAPLHRSGFLFTMQFRIGGTEVYGVPDTGSGVIWTNNSQLFEAVPVSCPSDDNGITTCESCGLCTFKQAYSGGDVNVAGAVGEAKLTFDGGSAASHRVYTTPDLINIGSALIPCIKSAENKACKAYKRGGIVGLNRDKLSLVSQLWLHSFSYCLPHHDHETTTIAQIKFNDTAAAVSLIDGTKKTPQIKFSDPASSKNYVVGLKDIRVGSTIAKSFPADGCSLKMKATDYGAMVIDSGSDFTILPEEVFNDVKKHVKELLKKLKKGEEPIDVPHKRGFSCYQGTCPDEGMGSIKLDFCGDDEGPMEIPAKNYLFKEGEDLCCLAFRSTDTKKWSSIILGAYQQQDMRMLFDIGGNTLSFAAEPSGCGSQSQSQEENQATM